MCKDPVTLGGGLTMVNGCASGRSGRNSPFSSQCAYHFASMAAGSNVLASEPEFFGVMSGRAFASGFPREQAVLSFETGLRQAQSLLRMSGVWKKGPLILRSD